MKHRPIKSLQPMPDGGFLRRPAYGGQERRCKRLSGLSTLDKRPAVRIIKGGFVDYERLAAEAGRGLTQRIKGGTMSKALLKMNQLRQFGCVRSGEWINEGWSFNNS